MNGGLSARLVDAGGLNVPSAVWGQAQGVSPKLAGCVNEGAVSLVGVLISDLF